jgi:hypothetical protein
MNPDKAISGPPPLLSNPPVPRKRYTGMSRDAFRRSRSLAFVKHRQNGSLREQIESSISAKEVQDLLHGAGKMKNITPGTLRALTRAAHERLKELETA